MISGCCGLGYEVIYVRMFSNYFGDAFVVSAALLTVVFLGIAFGAYQSHRLMGYLGSIEIAIGIYSIFVVSLLTWKGFEIVAFLGGSDLANAIKLYVLLLPPTFLIGTCVPLFSEYMRELSPDGERENTFSFIYALYNFGAFISIVIVEFFLFRYVGILLTVYILAVFNLVIGAILLLKVDQTLQQKLVTKSAKVSYDKGSSIFFIVLFAASFCSGIYQVFSLQLISSIFGPLKENFAVILISAILGLAIGPAIYSRYKISISAVLALLIVAFSLSILSLATGIEVWSRIASADINSAAIVMAKVALILLFSLPSFIMFGMMVPLIVFEIASSKPIKTSRLLAGEVLAVSSLANGVGAFLFVVIIHQSLPLYGSAILVGLILIGAYCAVSLKKLRISDLVFNGFVGFVLMCTAVQIWPTTDILLGYKTIANERKLSERRAEFVHSDTYKFKDQNASLLHFTDGSSSLLFNGYQSLNFNKTSRVDLHEAIVGGSAALFSKKNISALVFGLGTGISAGATASVFDEVDVVEINPAIFEMPVHFENQNNNIMHAENVSIRLEDGISTLVRTDKKYDVIVNTVTSPQFYSAVKMYTADFYSVVNDNLNNGGAYSSWFDINIGFEGISIMLNTLEASFEKCRYFMMASGYFNVVCGAGDLSFNSEQKTKLRFKDNFIQTAMQKYGFNTNFERLMRGIEIDFGKDFFKRTTLGINTLNQPIIEFLNITVQQEQATQEMLTNTLEQNIALQKLVSSRKEQIENCALLQHMVRLHLNGCHGV